PKARKPWATDQRPTPLEPRGRPQSRWSGPASSALTGLVRVLATREELSAGAEALRGAPRYYIDTEFESAKRGKRLSLIQISRGEEVFVIDVLELPSVSDLRAVIFAPGTEWVLHAGLQDVELLLAEFE